MPGTRKLGRATDSRNAMLRAMVTYLFENGKIETTAVSYTHLDVYKRQGVDIDKVVNLIVPDEAITRRMSGRRVCAKCGACLLYTSTADSKEIEFFNSMV